MHASKYCSLNYGKNIKVYCDTMLLNKLTYLSNRILLVWCRLPVWFQIIVEHVLLAVSVVSTHTRYFCKVRAGKIVCRTIWVRRRIVVRWRAVSLRTTGG